MADLNDRQRHALAPVQDLTWGELVQVVREAEHDELDRMRLALEHYATQPMGLGDLARVTLENIGA